MLITLAELKQRQFVQSFLRNDPDLFEKAPKLQRQLQQVVQQLRLGLPVALDQYPLHQRLVQELRKILPDVFDRRKRILLNEWIRVPVNGYEPPIRLEIPVNIGFQRNHPILLDWSLRSPQLTWLDRVRLWAIAEQFQVTPGAVKGLIIAFHPANPTRMIRHHWSRKQHNQIHQWLIELFDPSQLQIIPDHKVAAAWLDIEAIEEVSID